MSGCSSETELNYQLNLVNWWRGCFFHTGSVRDGQLFTFIKLNPNLKTAFSVYLDYLMINDC